MVLDVESMQWKYLTEGGANIILTNGFNVLRVRKNVKIKCSTKIYNAFTLRQEGKFIKEILLPLFKKEDYLVNCQCINLSKSFLNELKLQISEDRPEKRKIREIDTSTLCAQLMPNYAFLSEKSSDCIAVEIKTKCGVLPDFYSGEKYFKNDFCRFCMHQQTKIMEGHVEKRSKYCPIDLYSNCSCRVRNALEGLFETPQNNLFLALNGRRINLKRFINGGNNLSHSLADIIEILIAILYRDSKCPEIKESQNTCNNNKNTSRRCKLSTFEGHHNSCQEFGDFGILNQLKELQHLDDLGIEKIHSFYEKFLKSESISTKKFEDFGSDMWREFHMSNFQNDYLNNREMYTILKYLIASTLKDITVIITFAKLNENDGLMHLQEFVELNGEKYYYQIKVVDLDPKYVHNIPFYYHLDDKITNNFKKYLDFNEVSNS